MKIENIEDNIERILEPNYTPIIELIVDAVRTYPLFGLNDTEDYFKEIKKTLKLNEISLYSLKIHLENGTYLNDENTVWIVDSLNSLIEAFELMHLYKISFDEVRSKMESLSPYWRKD